MIKVEKIWLTDDAVWIKTDDGREACEKFADYPRLKYATTEQRSNYVADAFGLHWDDIDEDLSFEGFFDKEETTMGISQSLMAQYISGKKSLSESRKALILDTVRAIGQELIAV